MEPGSLHSFAIKQSALLPVTSERLADTPGITGGGEEEELPAPQTVPSGSHKVSVSLLA